VVQRGGRLRARIKSKRPIVVGYAGFWIAAAVVVMVWSEIWASTVSTGEGDDMALGFFMVFVWLFALTTLGLATALLLATRRGTQRMLIVAIGIVVGIALLGWLALVLLAEAATIASYVLGTNRRFAESGRVDRAS
jgi:O-antigen/teichoic acid export membrane protein